MDTALFWQTKGKPELRGLEGRGVGTNDEVEEIWLEPKRTCSLALPGTVAVRMRRAGRQAGSHEAETKYCIASQPSAPSDKAHQTNERSLSKADQLKASTAAHEKTVLTTSKEIQLADAEASKAWQSHGCIALHVKLTGVLLARSTTLNSMNRSTIIHQMDS